MPSSVPRAQPLSVDVAIVNWNTADAAREAGEAYAASAGVSASVTIVDNDSQPQERERLERTRPPGVELILSPTNLGFGSAANLGLREGSAEFVCVSNADVVPDRDALAALAEFCDSHPDCGMVGPAFAEHSTYHARLPKPGALILRPLIGGFGHRWEPSPAPGDSVEVEQPAGACFMVRRGVWEQVGGFDESFFLWYEDVDLARRLLERGLRNFVTGDAVVRHNQGLAARAMPSGDHQRARLDGLDRYLRKHHPRARSVAAPILAIARRVRAPGSKP